MGGAGRIGSRLLGNVLVGSLPLRGFNIMFNILFAKDLFGRRLKILQLEVFFGSMNTLFSLHSIYVGVNETIFNLKIGIFLGF